MFEFVVAVLARRIVRFIIYVHVPSGAEAPRARHQALQLPPPTTGMVAHTHTHVGGVWSQCVLKP